MRRRRGGRRAGWREGTFSCRPLFLALRLIAGRIVIPMSSRCNTRSLDCLACSAVPVFDLAQRRTRAAPIRVMQARSLAQPGCRPSRFQKARDERASQTFVVSGDARFKEPSSAVSIPPTDGDHMAVTWWARVMTDTGALARDRQLFMQGLHDDWANALAQAKRLAGIGGGGR